MGNYEQFLYTCCHNFSAFWSLVALAAERLQPLSVLNITAGKDKSGNVLIDLLDKFSEDPKK